VTISSLRSSAPRHAGTPSPCLQQRHQPPTCPLRQSSCVSFSKHPERCRLPRSHSHCYNLLQAASCRPTILVIGRLADLAHCRRFTLLSRGPPPHDPCMALAGNSSQGESLLLLEGCFLLIHDRTYERAQGAHSIRPVLLSDSTSALWGFTLQTASLAGARFLSHAHWWSSRGRSPR
jgi:hypothetical protein